MACLEQVDPRETVDSMVGQDQRVNKAPAPLHPRVTQVPLAPLDSLAPEETLDSLDHPVFLVKRETLDCQETVVFQVCLDKMAVMDLLVQRDGLV